MIAVFKDKNNHCVMRTRLSEKNSTFITVDGSERILSHLPNREFNKKYRMVETSPLSAIITWMQSTIPVTLAVKKEIQMVIAILKNKIVAKAETVDELGELKDGTVVIAGVDDLQGKDMKALIKLYNTTLAPADRVKVMPGVEGDLNLAMAKTFEALENFSIPEKTPKAKSEKKASTRQSKTYERTDKALVEGVTMPEQAKVILTVLAQNEGPMSKEALVAALDGKLTTKQPIERIIAFYQKRLVEDGYITMA